MRELRSYVHIDGTAYGPRDLVPEEVAERITNPKAWASAPMEAAEAPVRRPAVSDRATPDPDRVQDENPDESGPDGATVEDQGDDEEPKRPAKNASEAAWREYILATVDVTEEDLQGKSRADLIAMDAEAVEE